MTMTRSKSSSNDTSRHPFSFQWNRALSLRSHNRSSNRSSHTSTGTTVTDSTAPTTILNNNSRPGTSRLGPGIGNTPNPSSNQAHRHTGFSLPSLRNPTHHKRSSSPPLSKRIQRLIKTSSDLISAHESVARSRLSVATQLSEWGEQASRGLFRTDTPATTNGNGVEQRKPFHNTTTPLPGATTADAGINDLTDKIGVLLSELGEQEAAYAARLETSRGLLKAIRDTERSVQPARDGRRKVAEELARLRAKDPASPRLATLEQELVRAEAEGLVAEAQLGNVTRQKLREAYTLELAATIELAEKQAMLARHGLRLLQLLDVTPSVPGESRPPYPHAGQARQILNDAEDDLREWRLDLGFLDVREEEAQEREDWEKDTTLKQNHRQGEHRQRERTEENGEEQHREENRRESDLDR